MLQPWSIRYALSHCQPEEYQRRTSVAYAGISMLDLNVGLVIAITSVQPAIKGITRPANARRASLKLVLTM